MTINKLNYEAFALEYLEGELSAELKQEMEQLMRQYPEIKAELEEMKGFLYLEPEVIIYESKETLLKESKPNKVIGFLPWRLGIAASTLFIISGIYFFQTPIDLEVLIVVNEPKEEALISSEIEGTPNTKEIIKEATIADKDKGGHPILQKSRVEATYQIDQEDFIVSKEVSNYTTNHDTKNAVDIPTKQANNTVEIPEKEFIATIEITQQKEGQNILKDSTLLYKKEEVLVAALPILTSDLLEVPSNYVAEQLPTLFDNADAQLAKVEVPKKRSLKKMIGNLPGEGIKISLLPSFFTD